MTYQPGDPNHIGVHNTLAADVAALAAKVPISVTLPPNKTLGDSGHVNDHNLIVDAIQQIADAGGATDWADFSIPGVTPVEHISNGIDGIQGAKYKTWRIDSSVNAQCIKPGIAELYLVGGGGGGGCTGGQYPTGGGGAGGIYINQGEEFATDNDGGVYVIVIGSGAGGGGVGGDTSIKCGDGTTTLVTKDIGCGGGGNAWSTGNYEGCSYKNARPGWGGGGDGGGGGKNGNPGSSCCDGKSNAHTIFGGTETIGNNTSGGCGSCAGKAGKAIIRVLLEMP